MKHAAAGAVARRSAAAAAAGMTHAPGRAVWARTARAAVTAACRRAAAMARRGSGLSGLSVRTRVNAAPTACAAAALPVRKSVARIVFGSPRAVDRPARTRARPHARVATAAYSGGPATRIRAGSPRGGRARTKVYARRTQRAAVDRRARRPAVTTVSGSAHALGKCARSRLSALVATAETRPARAIQTPAAPIGRRAQVRVNARQETYKRVARAVSRCAARIVVGPRRARCRCA